MHPFEFMLYATPVSLQTRRRERLHQWKAEVRSVAEASRGAFDPRFEADEAPVAATIMYFTAAELGGDIDNIVKPILDALVSVAYADDRQVERVVVQKIEPRAQCVFVSPSEMLTKAIAAQAPAVYVRIDADFGWRTVT